MVAHSPRLVCAPWLVSHTAIRAKPKVMRLLALVAITFLVTTGCRTANGFGKDMENAGEKIQNETR